MLHGSSNVMFLKMVKFAEELEEEKWKWLCNRREAPVKPQEDLDASPQLHLNPEFSPSKLLDLQLPKPF